MYVEPGKVEKQGLGPMNGRLDELRFGAATTTRCAGRYPKHVETVDEWSAG